MQDGARHALRQSLAIRSTQGTPPYADFELSDVSALINAPGL
jgi:hypothetical protein